MLICGVKSVPLLSFYVLTRNMLWFTLRLKKFSYCLRLIKVYTGPRDVLYSSFQNQVCGFDDKTF